MGGYKYNSRNITIQLHNLDIWTLAVKEYKVMGNYFAVEENILWKY